MAIHTKTPPKWYSLTHHGRYRRLQKVRRVWCRHAYRSQKDCRNRTVYLDGSWITDVPNFYLSLGEAINGPNGYFGGCLDSLDDCLIRGFGISTPLTVRLSHFDAVRNALDGRAWCRHHAEICLPFIADDMASLVDCGYFGDGSPADIDYWTVKYEAAFVGEPFEYSEYGSYFDSIVDIFEQRGAALIPDNDEVSCD